MKKEEEKKKNKKKKNSVKDCEDFVKNNILKQMVFKNKKFLLILLRTLMSVEVFSFLEFSCFMIGR